MLKWVNTNPPTLFFLLFSVLLSRVSVRQSGLLISSTSCRGFSPPPPFFPFTPRCEICRRRRRRRNINESLPHIFSLNLLTGLHKTLWIIKTGGEKKQKLIQLSLWICLQPQHTVGNRKQPPAWHSLTLLCATTKKWCIEPVLNAPPGRMWLLPRCNALWYKNILRWRRLYYLPAAESCIHRLLGTCQSPTTDLEASCALISEQWRMVFNWHRSLDHVGVATVEQPFPSRWQKHLASEDGYTFYWIYTDTAHIYRFFISGCHELHFKASYSTLGSYILLI